jgi:hypothetical protein
MSISVEEVRTAEVTFRFPVDVADKKSYAKAFREFGTEIEGVHPDLAGRFEELAKALGGRKSSTKKVAEPVQQTKKKPPRRVAQRAVTTEDSNVDESGQGPEDYEEEF